MDNCIFCKIINGHIPASKIYEDDNVFVFLDISQVTKGHTLVIPKLHKENIYELTPEIASKLFAKVPLIANAIKEQFNPVGLNILNNNGEFAGQSVFHYHLHLIPRYDENDGLGVVWETNNEKYSADDLQQIAQKIAESI